MRIITTVLGFALVTSLSAAAGPDSAQWQSTVDKAIAFLKSSQERGGSWSSSRSPGVTGIVVAGMLKTGRVKADGACGRGLKYIESLINEKAGHIAGQDPKAATAELRHQRQRDGAASRQATTTNIAK